MAEYLNENTNLVRTLGGIGCYPIVRKQAVFLESYEAVPKPQILLEVLEFLSTLPSSGFGT
jgi:hypothetical protein